MPMEMALADLFQIGQQLQLHKDFYFYNYLLLVDRHSGFPLLARLRSLTSHAVVDKMHAWFELFRYPRIHVYIYIHIVPLCLDV